MYNVKCVMEYVSYTFNIVHYSLYPAVAVQLGLVDCKV